MRPGKDSVLIGLAQRIDAEVFSDGDDVAARAARIGEKCHGVDSVRRFETAIRYEASATRVSALSPMAIELNSIRPPTTAPRTFHPNATSVAGSSRKTSAKQIDAKKIGVPTKRMDKSKRAATCALRIDCTGVRKLMMSPAIRPPTAYRHGSGFHHINSVPARIIKRIDPNTTALVSHVLPHTRFISVTD